MTNYPVVRHLFDRASSTTSKTATHERTCRMQVLEQGSGEPREAQLPRRCPRCALAHRHDRVRSAIRQEGLSQSRDKCLRRCSRLLADRNETNERAAHRRRGYTVIHGFDIMEHAKASLKASCSQPRLLRACNRFEWSIPTFVSTKSHKITSRRLCTKWRIAWSFAQCPPTLLFLAEKNDVSNIKDAAKYPAHDN